jgi:glycosyltransferase involved in cell wall biosynthesis
MRILHIIRSFGFGGAENHVRDLANVLDESGHEIFIMARPGKQNKLLNRSIKFISLKVSDAAAIFQIFRVARFVKNNNIDIIHAHQRLPVFIGCLAGRLTGTPVVVTVHGQIQYDVRSPLARKWVDRFIFVRQTSFNDATRFGIPESRAVMIQNGVKICDEDFKRDNKAFCYISRTDKRHGTIISLIITRLMPSLCKKFGAVTFNVVGDGDYLDVLKKEAEEMKPEIGDGKIVFHGYKPDVAEVIKTSGMVIGVGRVAMEALACGVPVLSVNQKYFGGLVGRNNYDFLSRNNFVAYGLDAPDENKIGSELEKYFSDMQLWQEEASHLKTRIDEDFNLNKIAGRIISLYTKLLETKSSERSNGISS